MNFENFKEIFSKLAVKLKIPTFLAIFEKFEIPWPT